METNNKLREALAPFPSLCDWLVKNAARLGILDMVVKLRERGDKARAALAEPVRQCDVGTVEEQAKRMDEFCDSHGHGFDGHRTYACENCKFISVDRCELAWAQMPYEAQEGGAE